MLHFGGWLMMKKDLAGLLAVFTFSCCLLGQSKLRTSVKSAKPETGTAAEKSTAASQEVSREFMVLGRKAFAALDRLNEHFLDTKTVALNGRREAVSEEKMSWILRSVAAEEAADELMAVAESPVEKQIASRLHLSLFLLQGYHAEIDVKVTQAAITDNLHELEMETLTGKGSGFSSVAQIQEKAATEASALGKKLFEDSCFLAAKEAVISETLKMPAPCRTKALETESSPASQ
jgi:hypothetical protein